MTALHIVAEAAEKPKARRGTTNRNDRGNSEDRRRRREFLVETYRADADMHPVIDWYVRQGTTDGLRGLRHLLVVGVQRGQGVPACRCYRCGHLLTVDTVTVDRIIPGCKGGTYRRNNIRPACAACNSETGGALACVPKKREERPEVRVDQTIFVTDPERKGNCVSACVATLLGVPLDRVPHFVEYGLDLGDEPTEVSNGNAWWAMMLGYFYGAGYELVELDSLESAESDEPLLVAGKSPRGVLHQVIYRDGVLWHDPHPSRDGVLDVQEVLAVRPLSGFDHTPTEVAS